MMRFFDMADHARLPWRFTRENRSVLARRSWRPFRHPGAAAPHPQPYPKEM